MRSAKTRAWVPPPPVPGGRRRRRRDDRGIPAMFLAASARQAVEGRPPIIAAKGRWTVRVRGANTIDQWLILHGSTDRAEAEAMFFRERAARVSSAGRGGEIGLFDPAHVLVESARFWEGDHGA